MDLPPFSTPETLLLFVGVPLPDLENSVRSCREGSLYMATARQERAEHQHGRAGARPALPRSLSSCRRGEKAPGKESPPCKHSLRTLRASREGWHSTGGENHSSLCHAPTQPCRTELSWQKPAFPYKHRRSTVSSCDWTCWNSAETNTMLQNVTPLLCKQLDTSHTYAQELNTTQYQFR